MSISTAIYRLNTKIRLTMLCLSGFELYSRWLPLTVAAIQFCSIKEGNSRVSFDQLVF